MNYGFIIDNRRCIGCHACTVACKAEHGTPVGVNRTWVKYVEKGVYPETRRLFTVHRCNHCVDAPCVEICPVTSLFIRPDGIVDFDRDRCIGCKACMQACPYDALHIDPDLHTSSKCNYCAHRIDRGLEPACVIVCPVQAIISGDLDDTASNISITLRENPTSVRKPEKETRPKLYYIAADRAAIEPEQAPPSLLYTVTEQMAGVGHFARPAGAGTPAGGGAKITPYDPGNLDDARLETPAGGLDAAAAPRRVYDIPQRGVLWGWEVSGYLWTKSIATGVLFAPLLLAQAGAFTLRPPLAAWLGLTSLVFLGLTGMLLVKDLDQPSRFLYVLLRPQWRSWLVRGAYLITAFGAGATAWLVMAALGFAAPSWLGVVLVVLGIPTAVYTALLLRQATGRELWRSPVLPVRMLLAAALTGTAAAALLALWADRSVLPPLVLTLQVLLAAHLVLMAGEVALPHGRPDALTALRLMRRGPLAKSYWSALLLGNGLPLAVLVFSQNDSLVPGACVLVLFFALISEHVWVRAPQLIPLS